MRVLKTARLLLVGATSVLAVAAHAADAVMVEEVYLPLAAEYPDWSGFYVGGNVGLGGFGTNVTDLYDDMFDQEGGQMSVFGLGAIAGGQVGFNMMDGRYVFGVEGDLQWTSFGESSVTDGTDHRMAADWNWFGTVRARAGVTDQNTLFYVTGGVAAVNAYFCGADGECETDGDEDLAFSETRFGYAAGAGFETRLTSSWSIKGEYLFVGVPRFNVAYDDDQVASFRTQAHTFRVGANYHFGGLGAPVAAVAAYAPFQGAYVGVSGGAGGFGTGVIDLDGDMFDGDGAEMNVFGNGLVFGAQAGYNWTVADWVWGVEADFQGTTYRQDASIDDDHVAGGGWNWFSTVRGRAGKTFGDTLIYGTAGVAIVNAYFCGGDGSCVNDGDEDLAFDETVIGYTVGMGAERKLTDRLSVKGEYLFVDGLDFDEQYDDSDPNQRANFRTSGHVFRVGLNYAFN